MKEYTSRVTKIYYRNDKQFVEELKMVLKNAEISMGVTTRIGMPEMTTTNFCSDVYYYVQT